MRLFPSPTNSIASKRPQFWFAVSLLLILFCPASRFPLHAQNNTNKWLQIPDASPNGLDVFIQPNQWLADDFLCTSTGPITEVHIWGSWLSNQVPPVTIGPCFTLGIWSDTPSQPGCPSHPNQLLCNVPYAAGGNLFNIYTNGVNEQFFSPNCGGGAIIGTDTIIYEYVFYIPTNMCFQTNGNVYWLSLQANCYPTNQYRFGWKTCPTNWNDGAVFSDPTCFQPCASIGPWNPLLRPPLFITNLNLAFEIITTPTNPPVTTNVDKWLQIPDVSSNGLDVLDTDPKFMADDFLCTATGPITQIRVWGFMVE